VGALNEFLNRYKIPIALSLVGVVLTVGGIFSSGLINTFSKVSPESISTAAKSASKASPQAGLIKVDIGGAVNKPGVYSLPKDARVEDGLKQAGGFVASASAIYISKQVNLSQKLSDGQKLYIPFEGEQGIVGNAQAGEVAGATAGKVGINTATEAQLDTLPGVGPATVAKIIAGRPYQDLGELVSKKVVGKATYDKIKDLIDLN
jgi:competence protein ComEA